MQKNLRRITLPSGGFWARGCADNDRFYFGITLPWGAKTCASSMTRCSGPRFLRSSASPKPPKKRVRSATDISDVSMIAGVLGNDLGQRFAVRGAERQIGVVATEDDDGVAAGLSGRSGAQTRPSAGRVDDTDGLALFEQVFDDALCQPEPVLPSTARCWLSAASGITDRRVLPARASDAFAQVRNWDNAVPLGQYIARRTKFAVLGGLRRPQNCPSAARWEWPDYLEVVTGQPVEVRVLSTAPYPDEPGALPKRADLSSPFTGVRVGPEGQGQGILADACGASAGPGGPRARRRRQPAPAGWAGHALAAPLRAAEAPSTNAHGARPTVVDSEPSMGG
jgi:hypothetical protein